MGVLEPSHDPAPGLDAEDAHTDRGACHAVSERSSYCLGHGPGQPAKPRVMPELQRLDAGQPLASRLAILGEVADDEARQIFVAPPQRHSARAELAGIGKI